MKCLGFFVLTVSNLSFQTPGGPTDRSVRGAHGQQHHDLECCDFWAARHTVRGRHLQADDRVHRGVPEQAADGSLRVENVPPERVRRRGHLSGHSAEQMESHVRCVSNSDLHTGEFDRLFRDSAEFELFASLFQSLLSDPNPNSPANSMAAQLYKENRREYEKRVKACVEQSFID